nr:glycosyltransferase [Micromonospora sp.]
MRILFVPMPMPTHYLSMVPLAWAFRAAGHEVRFAAQPAVADAIRRSGLTGAPVGGGYDFAAAIAERRRARRESGEPLTPDMVAAMSDAERRAVKERMFTPQVKAAEAIADGLVAYARRWRPELVVADPLALAGPLAAAAAGAPLVRHLWGPDVIGAMGFPGRGLATDQWPDPLLRLYGAHGVEPAADYAVRTVDICPPSLRAATGPERLPMRFVPYNGPGIEPEWAAGSGRRRVCVTWGMSASAVGGREGFLVPWILAGLAEFDVEIVLAIKAADRALLGDLPPGTLVAEEVPLHLLLPSCDAIVHQGGGGTLLTAAALGVPQLIVTNSGDQTFNARLLTATGAAVSVHAEDAADGLLKETAARLLHDDAEALRAAADVLRAEIQAQPAPAEVAAALASVTASMPASVPASQPA